MADIDGSPIDEPETQEAQTLIYVPGFEIIQQLGGGHAGRVMLATTTEESLVMDRGTPVALKLFEGKKAMRDYEVERTILREVRGHPNIVRLLEEMRLDHASTPAAIVTSFCSGGSLFNRMQQERRPLQEYEASRAIVDTLQALQHIHALQVIHRDVKPENVMRESSGRCVLIDFDIACHMDDVLEKKKPRGTPGYMAPELILRKDIDCSVDLFSLGSMLYTLFRLCHPFTTKLMTDKSILRKNALCDYRFGPHFDHVQTSGKELISLLLACEPGRRPTAEQALTHRWLVTDAAEPPVAEDEEEEEEEEQLAAAASEAADPPVVEEEEQLAAAASEAADPPVVEEEEEVAAALPDNRGSGSSGSAGSSDSLPTPTEQPSDAAAAPEEETGAEVSESVPSLQPQPPQTEQQQPNSRFFRGRRFAGNFLKKLGSSDRARALSPIASTRSHTNGEVVFDELVSSQEDMSPQPLSPQPPTSQKRARSATGLRPFFARPLERVFRSYSEV